MFGSVDGTCLCVTLALLSLIDGLSAGSYRSRAEIWGSELTGESSESMPSAQQQEQYKQNLLQYVFRTNQPSSAELNTDSQNVPFVMNQLYELLADRGTGQEKRTTPFDVDYIRGLQDYWGEFMHLNNCTFKGILFRVTGRKYGRVRPSDIKDTRVVSYYF